jgi:hypothetical protein
MIGAPGIERTRGRAASRATGVALLGVLLLTGGAPAGSPRGKATGKATGKAGTPVARCETVPGALLERSGSSWQPVKAGATLRDGAMLVALPKAEILSKNGAVRLAMLADIGQRGLLPVLESAVALHASSKADLEFTLDRGLITLTNVKKAGVATVRLRVGGETWELTLREPGTKVGIEVIGRHPPGPPQAVKGKVEPPTTELVLLVVKGQAFLDAGPKAYALGAPPGLALVRWDSLAKEAEPTRLEKLPEGVRPLDDKESKLFQEICTCAGHLTAKDVGKVVDHFLHSANKVERLFGVTAAGAVDDLPRVLTALADPKYADLRDHTVLVLRNWMGRGPGQVEKLHEALRKAKYSEVQTRTILRLLFGFTPEERADPGTYEMLIGFLKHSQLPVRELARWHLVRLVAAGRDIPYDAAAPAAERQRGHAAWQALVPEGKLPPEPKKSPAPK